MTSNQRRLELEGAYNIRDVGGYRTTTGQAIRWRTLLRADSPHALSPAAQAFLLEYGLRTIIDLRRDYEVKHDPNVFAASEVVHYRHMALFNDEEATILDAPTEDLEVLYRGYLDHCQPALARILGTIANSESGPVMVHCKVGKDRTGTVIALALAAAGVDDKTIAEDYAQSHGYLQPLLQRWRAQLIANGQDTSRYDQIVQSPAAVMHNTLGYLRQRYDSIDTYLLNIGLTPGQISDLRTKLIDE
jgi:protein-tyrosine phosphatase